MSDLSAIYAADLSAHDAAREEAFYDAVESGYFDPDFGRPAPREYRAPCGCVGRHETDGDDVATWREWRWFEPCATRGDLS